MKFEDYFDYLINEKHYSKHTITAYRNDLEQFEDFILKTFEKEDPRDVSFVMIRDWIVSLSQNNISNRSINRKLSSLRSYFHFLIKVNHIEVNPLIKINPLKTSKRNPGFIMEKDMEDIINMEYGEGFEGIRNKLIIGLLYATGMRKSELLNLEENDIDIGRKEIRIFGKRRKDRIVPIHTYIIDLIKEYLEGKRSLGNKEKILLVNNDDSPLSIRQFDKIVRESLALAHIDQKTPHILRHTFATHLLNEGANIMNIKDLLGHKSLTATEIYSHNTIEKLKSVYKQTHPRGE